MDADGTPDRYECLGALTNPNKKKVCDGDEVSQNKEQSGCDHPGADHLPSIFPNSGREPGAPEICDGNDND